MHFPTIINWTSPLPILGLLGGIFHFVHILKDPDKTPRFVASDLDLHCLFMSHKKDDRLIRVEDKNVSISQFTIPSRVNSFYLRYLFIHVQ